MHLKYLTLGLGLGYGLEYENRKYNNAILKI